MARLEGETGNAGGVREWLARAVTAPRDPAWTADGVVADDWGPVSPVTGALDAFRWRVPVEAAEPRDKDLLAQKIDELVKVGARPETVLAAGSAAVAAPTEARPAPHGDADRSASDAISVEPARSVDAVDVEVEDAKVLDPDVIDADVVDVVQVVPAQTRAAKQAQTATGDGGIKVVEMAEPEPVAAAAPGKTPAGQTETAATGDGAAAAGGASPGSSGDAKAQTTGAAAAQDAPSVEPKATPGAATRPGSAAAPGEPTGEGAAKTPKRPANGSGGSANQDRDEGNPREPEVVLTKAQESARDGRSKDSPASASERRGATEPKIFVSPRAPDDPGPAVKTRK